VPALREGLYKGQKKHDASVGLVLGRSLQRTRTKQDGVLLPIPRGIAKLRSPS